MDKIKDTIGKINDKSSEFGKYFMKIKSNSDENLTLNKILKPDILAVIARSVFEEDSKYYPQVFQDECLYKL